MIWQKVEKQSSIQNISQMDVLGYMKGVV